MREYDIDMKLTKEEKEELERLYQSFLHDERILKMKEIPMHRGSNCYVHTFKVVKKAIKMGLRKKNINLKLLLTACVFHDYYLYDWRVDRSKLKGHGRNHPYIAMENAERDFGISEEVKKIISTHMWPINITYFPSSKEAIILSKADKRVAFIEALSSNNYKIKKEKRYIEYISHLFDE